MRTLRFLQPIAPAHCVRRALPTSRLARSLPPVEGARPGGRGLGVRCHPYRSRGGVGDCRPPRFLGAPDESSPGSATPVGPLAEAVGASGAAPSGTRTKAPDERKLSRLDGRRSFWLSTLRGRDRSSPRKTRFRLSATLPGGIDYPQGPNRRFPRYSRYILSSFSRLRLAQRPLILAETLEAGVESSSVTFPRHARKFRVEWRRSRTTAIIRHPSRCGKSRDIAIPVILLRFSQVFSTRFGERASRAG
jgi:hypothetical protein